MRGVVGTDIDRCIRDDKLSLRVWESVEFSRCTFDHVPLIPGSQMVEVAESRFGDAPGSGTDDEVRPKSCSVKLLYTYHD